MAKANFELYRGYPEDAGDTLEKMIEKGQLKLLEAEEDGKYYLEPGIYSCHIFGENIYHILKVFCVREGQEGVSLESMFAELAASVQQQGTEKDGYQPTIVPKGAPEYFKRTQHDEMLCIWPDEVLKQYGAEEIPTHHQFISQEEMENRLETAAARCNYLHLYSVGKTKQYGFSLPMVVLTKDNIDKTLLWEEVLGKLATGGKLNIWYQAQIHGNEPASGAGALEIIDFFSKTEEAVALLENTNIVIFPRVNPEGAYLYRRMGFVPIDMNRDHLAADAYETQRLHRAFSILLPEVVLDCHECKFFLVETADGECQGHVKRGGEVFTSPATSLNIAEAIRNKSYDLCGQIFDEMREIGWDINHFGASQRNSLGRVFYGLYQSLSFLIETRGIGGGRFGFSRRTEAQKDIVLAYINRIVQESLEIKEAVAAARRKGNMTNVMVLHHGSSEGASLPYHGIRKQYYLDGSMHREEPEHLPLHDLMLRARDMALGYIIEADASYLDVIIEKVKNIGVSPVWILEGTSLSVRQYRCLGLREDGEHEKDIEAGLGEQHLVEFSQGAYLIQGEGPFQYPLAALMEPDVTDTVGTKGTLYQQELLEYDQETGLFPLYRIEK